jgi:hypothetical protein
MTAQIIPFQALPAVGRGPGPDRYDSIMEEIAAAWRATWSRSGQRRANSNDLWCAKPGPCPCNRPCKPGA